VKTTLELPESLVRAAEAAARRDGLPLDAFLASLLREKLAPRLSGARKEWPVAPPELDIDETRRIQKLIDDEFGKVEPESWR
jgi:hypothetical protein